jgi:hypothetical protein
MIRSLPRAIFPIYPTAALCADDAPSHDNELLMKYTTKIPAAVTEDERHKDGVSDSITRYNVVHVPTGEVVAYDVGIREVIEAMWLHSGHDYALRPRLTQPDEGADTNSEPQQVIGLFGPEWDVYLKGSVSELWQRSGITAYGITEREAVVNLFEEGFCRGFWVTGYKITSVDVPANVTQALEASVVEA